MSPVARRHEMMTSSNGQHTPAIALVYSYARPAAGIFLAI